jgi:protein-disulfide isomerase
MMTPYGFVGVGVAAGFLLGTVAMCLTAGLREADAATMDKSGIEAIVKDYIAAHGEELTASILAAQNRAQQAKLETIIRGDVPSKGPKDAPVTIVEFSDYQCPFCDRVQGSLNELRGKYGDKIRWVFKVLPLDFHPEAKPAAYAALAANKQGKFWEYHQLLWQRQANLGEKTYLDIANELKLDIKQFNKDRASDEVKAHVEQDQADAEAMGARGTPHFMINGEALSGAMPTGEFVKVIDAQLKQAGK